MSDFQISRKGLQIIIRYEGIHDGNLKKIGLQPKLCPADYWTIGYGHLVLDSKGKPYKGQESYERLIKDHPDIETMEIEEAIALLDVDCDYREKMINNYNLPLVQNQFDSLVSLIFNIGEGNFKSSTLLKLLKNSNPIYFNHAINSAFMAWNKGGGKLLPGLVFRRQTEALMFNTGELKFFN